jgi:hypothetical protein
MQEDVTIRSMDVLPMLGKMSIAFHTFTTHIDGTINKACLLADITCTLQHYQTTKHDVSSPPTQSLELIVLRTFVLIVLMLALNIDIMLIFSFELITPHSTTHYGPTSRGDHSL